MSVIKMAAPCLFGLESVLSGELKRIGAKNIEATDGKVTFTGDWNMAIAKNETVQLLCIIYIRDNTPSDLKIKLTYSDVEERGRYEKEEIIHIDIDENGELISRMLKREQQRTVEIGKKEVNGNK